MWTENAHKSWLKLFENTRDMIRGRGSSLSSEELDAVIQSAFASLANTANDCGIELPDDIIE